MKRIMILSGSNSPDSINARLAFYLMQQLRYRTEATYIDLRKYPLPLFNIEIEREAGVPVKALELRQLLSRYDGFVITVAEHNGSVTAFFKNAMDWLSRAEKNYAVFGHKPVLIAGTSPGPGGARSAIAHAENIIHRLAGKVVAKLTVPRFYDTMAGDDSAYTITDASIDSQLDEGLEKLLSELQVNARVA